MQPTVNNPSESEQNEGTGELYSFVVGVLDDSEGPWFLGEGHEFGGAFSEEEESDLEYGDVIFIPTVACTLMGLTDDDVDCEPFENPADSQVECDVENDGIVPAWKEENTEEREASDDDNEQSDQDDDEPDIWQVQDAIEDYEELQRLSPLIYQHYESEEAVKAVIDLVYAVVVAGIDEVLDHD